MPTAAVPAYLQKDGREFYLSTPRGHRFLLYFAAWGRRSGNEPDRLGHERPCAYD